ncbi:acyltransferase family protein [Stenotrophomonas maltophilia]|uniref:acyltransferase family protein n=1 Tax=Stenotrophomonas muris TaxID=2963283 RepID=UPI0013136F03|nr:acyltransferase [Stenotrophomonas maltophilia]
MDNKITLQSLQALRGVGAVAVVVFHALSLHPFFNFRAGAAGVDLFFVISGVVMYLSLRNDASPWEFLKRRFIRVVPMYWIATTLAIAYFYARYPYMTPSTEHIVRSYIFAPPPPGYQMPLLYPGWTLNYEVFFYAILGTLLVTKRLAAALTICVIVALGSLTNVVPAITGVYYFHQIILEFAAGMLIGMAIRHGYRPKKLEGFIYLALSVILFAVHNHYKPEGVLAWGVPSALMVVGALAFESSKAVTNRICQLIGSASYSIYLFHALAIWLVDWFWHTPRGVSAVLFAIALSVVWGVVAHFLMEKPLLRLMLSWNRGGRTAATPSRASGS